MFCVRSIDCFMNTISFVLAVWYLESPRIRTRYKYLTMSLWHSLEKESFWLNVIPNNYNLNLIELILSS